MRTRHWLTGVVGLVVVFAGGVFIGRYFLPSGAVISLPVVSRTDSGEHQLTFPTFWEAWDTLHKQFIGELKDDKLLYGAVEGMVRAAGDPYTAFADPDSTKQFEETLNGSFSGIGVEIGVQRGLITVIAPLDGSPAQAAGLVAGDIIVAVDQHTITQDMTIDDVVRLIRGERGTKVKLTVLHKDSRQTSDVEITRDRIEIESVKLKIDNKIAHLAIKTFDSETTQRFATAVQTILHSDVDGVILDMRGNPGGFLDAAVDVSSYFLHENDVVVSERGKKDNVHYAKKHHLLEKMPVVVLVDGGSASASEIVSGALLDQRHAPVVGVKTFGKGSVQEFVKLDDGSSLRVTVAKWYTPSGRSIHEEGIAPTHEVKQDLSTPADEQLEAAAAELKTMIK